MGKMYFSNTKTARPHLGFLIVALVILFFANIALTSCDNGDSREHYISYGVAYTADNNQYLIHLDNGDVVAPKNVYQLKDSLRLIMDFSILEVGDTTQNIDYNIEVNAIREVPVESILQHDEVLIDTLGNDPIEIRNGECWLANGFISIEFFCVGLPDTQHQIYMIQQPSVGNKIMLEIRHNGYSEDRYQLRKSYVSFPITKILEGMEKPVSIDVKYQDSDHSSKTITLEYK